jgi:epoxide hydrolase 4
MDGALTSMLNWYRALLLAPSPAESPVQPPIRVIWGDRDAALNADLAELGLQRCRRGEVIHLENATHWLHH